MIDRELALRWAAEPDFASALFRWSWFRDAAPLAVQRGAQSWALVARMEPSALARAFFGWIRAVEPQRHFQAIDGLDYAHFAAGALMQALVRAAPVTCERPSAQPADADALTAAWMAWPEARLQTRLVFTLLDAWRRSMGAPALALDETAMTAPHVASYFENLREDAGTASTFLDLFTGLEPAWRYPGHIEDRPAMQRALAARRTVAP